MDSGDWSFELFHSGKHDRERGSSHTIPSEVRESTRAHDRRYDLSISAGIFWEHRADRAIDHPRIQYTCFTRSTFTLHESIPSDLPIGVVFLLEFYGKREEVSILRIPDSTGCEEEVPRFIRDAERSCREEGETARFEGDIFPCDSVCLRYYSSVERETVFESDEHKK